MNNAKNTLLLNPVLMNKNLLCILMLLMLGLGAHCQMETFYESINIPYGYGGVWNMAKTSDKHFILLTSSDSASTHLMKVDTMGNIEWQKDLIRESATGGFPQAVIETTDSAFIVLTVLTISSYQVISIVKLDKDGNFLWAKQSEHSSSNSGSGITATEDGGFALVSNGCNWGQSVTRFTSNGDVLWQKLYENYSQALTSLRNIIFNKDHSLVILGITGDSSYDGLCLYSVDSTGNLLWYKTFQFPGNTEAKGLAASLDGGYVIAGNTSPVGSYDYRPFLLHTDNTGNILWTKKYNHNLKSTPNAVIQLADSGYVLTGSINYLNSLDVQMLNIKINHDGNFIWGHSSGNVEFNSRGYDEFNCSGWLEGNYFYSAGSAENAVFVKNSGITGIGSCDYDTVNFTAIPITIEQSAPQISCFGTMSVVNADIFNIKNTNYSGSILCSTEVAIEEIHGRNSIIVFPNPLKSLADIEFDRQMNDAQINIFNVQGRLVKQIKNIYSKSIILNRDNLPYGLYFIRMIEHDKVITTGKFMIVE
jgi:hypothetical protein